MKQSLSRAEDAVGRVSLWRGKEVKITSLSGGLTNENYLVEAGGQRYVMRIPGASTELLAIDRANEVHNTRAAASTGIGPAVLEHIPELDVMVLEFIPGPTMSATTLQSERMVDYELSGNNDPWFDLGNTAQEAGFDDGFRAVLCEAYFGRLDRQQLARMNLFALMSDIGWTLWGAIQAKISTLDFDFTDYYTTRWNRALQVMESDRFGGWLREARRAGP